MKTRNHDWLNMETLKPAFGIEAYVNGIWMNVAQDGVPCLFDTAAERDAKRLEIRKLNRVAATHSRK